MLKPIVIDFETEGIEGRPHYPPIPVGFSIKEPADRKARYYAFGHPTANNCTKREAMRVLHGAWKSSEPLLFHNAKFDQEVAQVHMECGPIAWDRVHDTMFLIYLVDPHADTFSLKPSAERILKLASTERDAVRDWLIEHQPAPERITAKNWGACICLAPGDLVGKYADGDVTRTIRLFNKLLPAVRKAGMMEAYDRERQLLPIILRNEQEGIRMDLKRLVEDELVFAKSLEQVDQWLVKRLKCPGISFDNDTDVVAALKASGAVTHFNLTEKGKESVSKQNLTPEMFNDQKVAQAFSYRNRLTTCLGTFIRPWIDLAQKDKGIVHTNWNQVRQSRGRGVAGTRTGRLSSHVPNFMNIPKVFDDKNDGYVHPTFLKVPELPLMRRYVLPDKGQVLALRDYNQQELRILAHFEDAELMRAYQENPIMDVHEFVRGEIHRIHGVELERRAVKILNFGMVYGMGLGALAAGLGCSVDEAKSIKAAQRSVMPQVTVMERSIRRLGDDGDYITTWGGRRYYAEPPKVIDGKLRTFSYKLLNYLIQGSAADCTKQAIINYDAIKRDGRFMLTVHDENVISVPKSALKSEMALLRDAMADVAFDVPMLSDGKFGPNWADLQKEKK